MHPVQPCGVCGGYRAGRAARVPVPAATTPPAAPTAPAAAGTPPAGGGPAGSAAPLAGGSASPLQDPCVVGTWTETSHQEDDKVGADTVRYTGHGAVQRFMSDGTVLLDFGPGVTYTGTHNGDRWERFHIPPAGTLRLEATNLWLHGRPGAQLIVYVPADEESAEGVRCLVQRSAAGAVA